MISALLIILSTICTICEAYEASLLLADGTNLNDEKLPKYSLNSIQPTLTWSVSTNNKDILSRGITPVSYKITLFDVSSSSRMSSHDIMESNVTYSSTTKHIVSTDLMNKLQEGRLYEWTVVGTLSNNKTYASVLPGKFRISLLKEQSWDGVSWLGSNDFNVYQTEFQVGKTIPKDAVLYICGLGYSNVLVNGKKVGSNHLVTAPWTANERLVGFSALDITPNLQLNQKNTITVMLGNGWRDQSDFKSNDPNELQGDTTAKVLRAQLRLSARDTKPVTFTGDGTWKATAGPSTYDSVYNGETFNATTMLHLFDTTIQQWQPAHILTKNNAPRGKMIPWSAPPVEITKEIQPISVSSPEPHIYVYDFGVNVAGVVRLNQIENCKKNEIIVMRHGEIMQHSGIPGLNHSNPNFIYTANLRSAKATDQYICNGVGSIETWYPTLTYHGFRYVEINSTLAPNLVLNLSSVTMLHFHSNLIQRTNVSFSQSPTLNTIQTMALGAQRSNFMTVPTDCDQRDERLGWMGDANLSGDSMALNYDSLSFLQFYVQSIASELNPTDGSLTDTVPFVRYGNRPGDVSWTGAFVNLIHVCLKILKDDTLIHKYLDQAVKQLHNIKNQAKNGLNQMHTPYGDWCPPPSKIGNGQGPKPSSPYTSAFSYLYMIRQVYDLAKIVNNNTIMNECQLLNQSVTIEFNNEFSDQNTSCYDKCLTQTSLVLALALNAAGTMTSKTQQLLINDIVTKHSNHYTVGIIGQKYLYDELKKAGSEELALTMLENIDYPSIGYYFSNTLEPASTNLWELPDAPFEGTGMNSRNHHMWSSYSAYLVRSIAGLDYINTGINNNYENNKDCHYHLRPASVHRLFSSSVNMLEKNGVVSQKWINHGGIQSRKVAVASNVPLIIGCGTRGGVVQSIDYLSFGTSMEKGNRFVRDSICHSKHKAIHESIVHSCIGKKKCEFSLSSHLFEPLPLTCHDDVERPLSLWVQATCTLPLSLEINVSLPIGSVATIDIPAYRLINKLNKKIHVTESGIDLFQKHSQLVGLKTYAFTKDHANRDILRVEIGSGQYNFIAETQKE